MTKRIVVLLLFVPAILWSVPWAAWKYLRHGKVDPMNTPMDKLIRWAR